MPLQYKSVGLIINFQEYLFLIGSITMNDHLLPGIYIIQVNAAEQQYTTKLLVH